MSPPYKARIYIIVRPNNMPKFCRAKVLRFLQTEFWPIFTDISEASSSCKDKMIKLFNIELNCDKKFAVFTLQEHSLQGHSQDFSKGAHQIAMAYLPPVVGCLLKGLQKGGSQAPQDPPLATPLICLDKQSWEGVFSVPFYVSYIKTGTRWPICFTSVSWTTN